MSRQTPAALPIGRMQPAAVLASDRRARTAADPRLPRRDTRWKEQAECAKPAHDSALWYPDGNAGPWMAKIQEAKDVCNGLCPVRDACAAYALEAGELHGVWGGLSESDRAALRRRESRQRQREAS